MKRKRLGEDKVSGRKARGPLFAPHAIVVTSPLRCFKYYTLRVRIPFSTRDPPPSLIFLRRSFLLFIFSFLSIRVVVALRRAVLRNFFRDLFSRACTVIWDRVKLHQGWRSFLVVTILRWKVKLSIACATMHVFARVYMRVVCRVDEWSRNIIRNMCRLYISFHSFSCCCVFDNREEAFIWLYANLLIKVNLVSVLELSSPACWNVSVRKIFVTLCDRKLRFTLLGSSLWFWELFSWFVPL